MYTYKEGKEKGKIQQVSNERLRTSNPNQLPSASLRYSLAKSIRLNRIVTVCLELLQYVHLHPFFNVWI